MAKLKEIINNNFYKPKSLIRKTIFSLLMFSSLSSFSQSPVEGKDKKIGFTNPDSIHLRTWDRNKDGVVDKFLLEIYSTKENYSYVFRDSSNSFKQLSEKSNVFYDEEYFEDKDFVTIFEKNYTLAEIEGGLLVQLPKTHFSPDFIKPYLFFPNGVYLLKNNFLQLTPFAKTSSLGDLRFGTLSITDQTLDNNVDSYFFKLNYEKGVVQIELRDRNADGVFEYAKVFTYIPPNTSIFERDFGNPGGLVSFIKQLQRKTYFLSSGGEIVQRLDYK